MECRDRLAFWLLELVLEPVRALSTNGDGGSVTVRAARGERRFDLTIDGDGSTYNWSFREVARPGSPARSSPLQEEGDEPLYDPEHAFWTAWGAIEEAVTLSASADNVLAVA